MAPSRLTATNTNELRNAPLLSSAGSSQLPFNGFHGTQAANPPPLPPRQSIQSYSGYNDFGRTHYPSYSNYLGGGSYYRGYGGNSFFGSYSPYSGMSGYNNYGYYGGPSGDVESRFAQYAEESTRPTFQVIETVLQTFSSITMMLDSTYFALNNSFRAILSVAESISRLRTTFSQLLSTFALIRFLKWLYQRLKYAIGLRNENDCNEELWKGSLEGAATYRPSSVSWSGLIILGALAIIPHLIYKLLNNAKECQAKKTDPKEWAMSGEPVYGATAQYDFVARSSDELSLKAGQKVWVAPPSMQPRNMPGWWRATDTVHVGLIPSNYVTIVGQMKKPANLRVVQNDVTQSCVASPRVNQTTQDPSHIPRVSAAVDVAAAENLSVIETKTALANENVAADDVEEAKTKESVIESSPIQE